MPVAGGVLLGRRCHGQDCEILLLGESRDDFILAGGG